MGIGVIRRHIFLCCEQTKPKCCTHEEGHASWTYLKERLSELHLVKEGGVYRTTANCLIAHPVQVATIVALGVAQGKAEDNIEDIEEQAFDMIEKY